MRFAERMLLNAKLYNLAPYFRTTKDGSRCALGLCGNDFQGAEGVYPWLFTHVKPPCDCSYSDDDLLSSYDCVAKVPASQVIAHLFNEHVAKGLETAPETLLCIIAPSHGGGKCPEAEKWTLEQLADWIESIDPTPREELKTEEKEEVREEIFA